MLNENSLVLCGATIGSNSFEDLVRAANLGGFDAISLMATFYEDALSRGLTINDMEIILNDNGIVIAEVDALLSWLPGSAPEKQASKYEWENYSKNEELFFDMATSLGARSINIAQAWGPQLPIEEVSEAFSILCEKAIKYDLLISLEFLPWSGIPNLDSAYEIIKYANQPNGGLMIDTWHHHRSGGSVEDLLVIPGNKIISTQINGVLKDKWEDIVQETISARLLPDEGVNDVIGFIKNLDLIKSKAPIGVEIFSEELYKLPKEEIGKITGYSVKKVVDKARKDT